MTSNVCKRWKIAVVFTVSSLMKILSTDITYIPGPTRPDDPHACVWITGRNGSSIYRCCDGYYKSDATNLTENCIECPNGSFGFFCLNICTCENGGTCNSVDGTCRCSGLYFGNKCQYACNCQNGATCMYDGRCMCVEGFYGELCERKCSCPGNSKCNGETGVCICHDGFSGDSCLPCNCSNTEQCDPFSGLCSCKPGRYGENCDKQCFCFNGAHCGYDNSNKCICPSGWVGPECTNCDTGNIRSKSFCEDKCLHCYNGNMCSAKNGDCECSPGWQGTRCDKKCKPGFYGNNCSEVCQCQNGMCDHVTGICQCESGWTGQHCEESCPDNCVVCKSDICTSCKSGWTGERCSNSCKPGFHGDSCQEMCTRCSCSTSCHHVNGSCPNVVRGDENHCKYQNARICTENPFELECQDGWTGRLCDIDITMTTTKSTDVVQTDNQGGTTKQTGDDYVTHDSSSHSGIVITTAVLVSVVVISIVIFLIVLLRRKMSTLSSSRNVCGKSPYSDREKRTSTSGYDDETSDPCLTAQSAAEANNIHERYKFTSTAFQQIDSNPVPIYASVDMQKKRTQRNYVVKETNQDIEPIEYDALIQSKETISTPKDEAIRMGSLKCTHENTSLYKQNANVNLNDNDKECDKFDKIGVKQYKNIDTDNTEYELLNYA